MKKLMKKKNKNDIEDEIDIEDNIL